MSLRAGKKGQDCFKRGRGGARHGIYNVPQRMPLTQNGGARHRGTCHTCVQGGARPCNAVIA